MKLDDSAERLYQMLGGIERSDVIRIVPAQTEMFLENLAEEERNIDSRRLAIIEAASSVTGYLNLSRLGMTQAQQTDALDGAIAALTDPKIGGVFMIRLRGGSVAGGGMNDYMVTGGALPVDQESARRMMRRMGAGASHILGRLSTSMKMLSDMRIHTLRVETGSGAELLRGTLAAVGDFYRSLSDVVKSAELIRDEYGIPDPNLNILKTLGKFDSSTFQNIVGKVASLLSQADGNPAMDRFINVYEALFSVKRIKDALVTPPVQINNARWLMYERMSRRVVYGAADVKVARAAMGAYRDAPDAMGQAMASLNGESYKNITPYLLERKLSAAGDLLRRLEKPELRGTAVSRIKAGLDVLPEEALDSVKVVNGRLHSNHENGGRIADTEDGDLASAVRLFQLRASARRKVRQMTRAVIKLTDEEVEALASDLNVDDACAREIISRLQACFTPTGRFLRRAFEESVPLFAPHGVKIFEFLRRFMDDMPDRDDRVALLNAMQGLISKITDRRGALRSLLEEFAAYPQGIRFSDRNTLLLATIMLRSYNKELDANIEVTPEEVLLVRKGLDQDALGWAREAIDDDSERLLEKTRALHEELRRALETGKELERPVRFLITTLREFYIFLSLCGSEMSGKIIRFSFKEMACPHSRIYQLAQDRGQVKVLFQLLQVILRGMLRFIAPGDLPSLRKMRESAGDFERKYGACLPDGSLYRIMGYVDEGIAACGMN